ncbi:Protein of unknown function [Gryllus bimaculatus]|nr:Protein of unknown function [Gryllus bimaculatus]
MKTWNLRICLINLRHLLSLQI